MSTSSRTDPAENTTPAQVLVIGGGISGLTAAWDLARSSRPLTITVIEASERLGGKIGSTELAGRLVDAGPDAFITRRPEALDLCAELEMTNRVVTPGVSGAYVWARHQLRRLPDGLMVGVPTRLAPLLRSGILTPSGTLRALLSGLVPPTSPRPGNADIPIGPMLRRSLGREVTDVVADPLLGGIHAGPIETMSVRAVMPVLEDASRRWGGLPRALQRSAPPAVTTKSSSSAPHQGSVFASLDRSMTSLVSRLGDALLEGGVVIRCHTAATALERTAAGRWKVTLASRSEDAGPEVDLEVDAVIVALPPDPTSKLIARCAPSAAEQLARIRSASVAVVSMAFETQSVVRELDATGFLVPARQGMLMTGATWLTAKWPHLARDGEVVMRASAGRLGDNRTLDLDDDELARRLERELAAIMGTTGRPTDVTVTRWPDAFPFYEVGHRESISTIESQVGNIGGLELAGAAYGGVGIPACISTARQAARRVLEHLPEGIPR